jgi:hypothetical protein
MLNPPSEMYRAASTVSPVKTPPYESTSAPIPPPMKLPASTIVQWRRSVGILASRSKVSATGGSVFSVYSW